jgi:hypothetical protein
VRGADSTSALGARLDTLAGLDAARGRGRFGGGQAAPSFTSINGVLANQLNAQEQADMALTEAALAAYATVCEDLTKVIASWQRLSTTELSALNATLKSRGRAALALAKGELRAPSCQ